MGPHLGLIHSFYGTDPRVFMGLDGVMSNTYGPGSQMMDPLEPTERYAFEPLDGYVDEASHHAEYNSAIIGSSHLPVCGHVDPAMVSASATASHRRQTSYRGFARPRLWNRLHAPW